MARHESTYYTCEKCKSKLNTCKNHVNIVTSLSESSWWSRLHVRIIHISGMHNDSTADMADLCQPCTVALLQDALKRVQGGERTTAGYESSDQQGWE